MSDFEELANLRARVDKLESGSWQGVDGLLFDVWNSQLEIGSFDLPAESGLLGLSLSQWQFEQTRRQVLAVLDFLLGQRSGNGLVETEAGL